MNRPKFRYVRRHGSKDLEPRPGVWAQAVSALRLGAVLAVIIAIGVMYLRSAMGVSLGEKITSVIVLVSFLLPSAVILGRAWWDRRHPKDPYAHLPAGRDGGRRVLSMPRRPRSPDAARDSGAEAGPPGERPS
jgi:amino acid transporter